MSLTLKGQQLEALCAALASAYPTWQSLDRLVEYGLGEPLEAHVDRGPTADVILDLARWARSQGRLEELIAAAVQRTPGNLDLRWFVTGLAGESVVLRAALDGIAGATTHAPRRDTTTAAAPEPALPIVARGGTVPIDDPLYVRRDVDELVEHAARAASEWLVIQAPLQRGKSSLLVRYLAACRRQGKRTIWIDLQAFDEDAFATYPAFLQTLGATIAHDLGLTETPSIERPLELQRFMERGVLAAGPVAIACDEVDRLTEHPICSSVFSLLRSWHNRRALPADQRWSGLSMALSMTCHPSELIESGPVSPFIVGSSVVLPLFTRAQCHELNDRLGAARLDAAAVDGVYDCVAGHPYLTRVAYGAVRSGAFRIPIDREAATSVRGVFGDHLGVLLERVTREPELDAAMWELGSTGSGAAVSDRAASRLARLGIIERRHWPPAIPLYEWFFFGAERYG